MLLTSVECSAGCVGVLVVSVGVSVSCIADFGVAGLGNRRRAAHAWGPPGGLDAGEYRWVRSYWGPPGGADPRGSAKRAVNVIALVGVVTLLGVCAVGCEIGAVV